MALAAQNARRERMRLERDALAHTKERLVQLAQDEYATLEVLHSAQAKLDVIRGEKDELEARQRTIQKSLDAVSATFRHTLWTTLLPADVLRYIFEQFSAMPDERWSTLGNGRFNAARAAVPFTLASICSSWRSLALSLPCLWTYISAPKPNEDLDDAGLSEAELDRIRLLLARSRSAPLDVLFRWDQCMEEDDGSFRTALLAVNEHSARFRRVELWLPPSIPRQPFMDAFRGPTPLLTHLAITAMDDENDDAWGVDPRDTYFPFAPNLLELDLQGTGMCCSRVDPSFQLLESIKLWTGFTAQQLYTIVSKSASSLQTLLVGGSEDLWTSLPSFPLVLLPKLVSVTITCRAHLMMRDTFTAPRLQCLRLNLDVIEPTLSPYLDAISPSVTTLILSGTDTPEAVAVSLAVLAALSNIEILEFADINGLYTIPDAFFSRLATATPVIWPKLRVLRLLAQGTSTVEPPNGDGILELVRTRTIGLADAPASDGPRRLEQVQLDYRNVPRWLGATVERMLKQ